MHVAFLGLGAIGAPMARHLARPPFTLAVWNRTRERAARRHLDAGLPHVAGDYMGEHWLATFALLALDGGPDE